MRVQLPHFTHDKGYQTRIYKLERINYQLSNYNFLYPRTYLQRVLSVVVLFSTVWKNTVYIWDARISDSLLVTVNKSYRLRTWTARAKHIQLSPTLPIMSTVFMMSLRRRFHGGSVHMQVLWGCRAQGSVQEQARNGYRIMENETMLCLYKEING